ncbi:unnamed protein product [Urochloa decumbens]|uniref:Uncharacterized protein n=1 Tax=Urochloa decumbens TaxID=240449 RepID=A0ABC9DYE9_9POAL
MPTGRSNMDRQSEWILLRRVYAFLKSRGLRASAHALEKEARLKYDVRRLYAHFVDGRWRRADQYVSAFMRGKENTPAASGALFVIRLRRLVAALRLGNRFWAYGYHVDRVAPLLIGHPDRAAASAQVQTALRAGAEGELGKAFPDGEENRRACFVEFLGYADENKHLYRCCAPLDLKLLARNSSITVRRHRRRHISRRQVPSQPAASTT